MGKPMSLLLRSFNNIVIFYSVWMPLFPIRLYFHCEKKTLYLFVHFILPCFEWKFVLSNDSHKSVFYITKVFHIFSKWKFIIFCKQKIHFVLHRIGMALFSVCIVMLSLLWSTFIRLPGSDKLQRPLKVPCCCFAFFSCSSKYYFMLWHSLHTAHRTEWLSFIFWICFFSCCFLLLDFLFCSMFGILFVVW